MSFICLKTGLTSEVICQYYCTNPKPVWDSKGLVVSVWVELYLLRVKSCSLTTDRTFLLCPLCIFIHPKLYFDIIIILSQILCLCMLAALQRTTKGAFCLCYLEVSALLIVSLTLRYLGFPFFLFSLGFHCSFACLHLLQLKKIYCVSICYASKEKTCFKCKGVVVFI